MQTCSVGPHLVTSLPDNVAVLIDHHGPKAGPGAVHKTSPGRECNCLAYASNKHCMENGGTQAFVNNLFAPVS